MVKEINLGKYSNLTPFDGNIEIDNKKILEMLKSASK